jgi:hypothetical protein
MAEKSAKKTSKKAAEASVLGNLSATRTPAATPTRKPAAKTSAPKQAEAKAAKLRKADPAPPAGWQTPGESGREQGGADIVTTAVQAAGELAQMGVTIGGRLLKRAAGRIPRP